MRKLYFILPPIILILIIGALYFLWQNGYLPVSQKAGLSIKSLNDQKLDVFLDNEKLGTIPFYSEKLKPGTYSLTLSNASASYSTPLKLVDQTLTVVNWALADEEIFSMGEVVNLEKSSKAQIAIISTPDKAKITIDDILVGVTPYLSQEIDEGKHKIIISKEGYNKHELTVDALPQKKLNVKIKLSLFPLPPVIQDVEANGVDFAKIKDLTVENSELTANPNLWVKGILFWLASSRDDKNLKFDYFLDYQGKIFSGQDGMEIEKEKLADLPKLQENQKLILGYLGNDSTKQLSNSADQALKEFRTALIGFIPKVKILSTGTGWLRVRSGPSKSDPEIAKVNVGDELELLEEQSGWYKIKLADGKEGWISASYAKKL